nr:MAG TPA: hypothetical protein [Caudoviricetes sp.]
MHKTNGTESGTELGGTKRDVPPSPSVLPRVSAERDSGTAPQSFRLDGGSGTPLV